MSNMYSMDLRERIVGQIATGVSCRAAGRHFGVSASTAIRLGASWRDTGNIEPKVIGRPKGSGKLAPHLDFLLGLIEATRDITLEELARALFEEHGITVHQSTIWRAVQAAGLTYKKIRYGVRVWAHRCPQGAGRLER